MAKWFTQFFKNNLNVRDIGDIRRLGQGQVEWGDRVANEGLAGLDDLDSRVAGRLDSGNVLTPEMENAFGLGRGRITDDAQRSRRAFADDLMQIARRTGGRLDPNAQVDYQIEREAGIDEDVFNSQNELKMREAELRLDQTNRLLDRLTAIRDRKLGAGETARELGTRTRIASLLAQIDRRKAIASTATNIMGMFGGGGGLK